jgi:hypothetical protein
MKGKPLDEAEKPQNTKNACHDETTRQYSVRRMYAELDS